MVASTPFKKHTLMHIHRGGATLSRMTMDQVGKDWLQAPPASSWLEMKFADFTSPGQQARWAWSRARSSRSRSCGRPWGVRRSPAWKQAA